MTRLLSAFSGLLLAGLLVCPPATAQLYGGLSGGYASIDEAARYGVGIAFYIPAFDHAFDISPSFDYFYRKWNDGETEVGTVWAVGLDARLNLPPVARLFRPYAGAGLSLVGVDGPGQLGLSLTGGSYLRLFVRDLYPFAQVTYRVTDEFEAVNLLDTVFVQTGIRFAIF